MKRRLVRICVFLLLGAIINVAVAWECAIMHNTAYPSIDLPIVERQQIWNTYAPSSYPALSDESRGSINTRFGSTWRMVAIGPAYAGFLLGRSEFGLPFRSLFGVIDSTEPTEGSSKTHFRGFIKSPVQYSHPQFHSGRVPIWPIWPGFAINTVFYAGVLWMLFAAPFAIRRLRGGRRIKRGLCPKCAYPVGDGSVCTECGAAVAKHKAETQKAEIA